MPYQIHIINTLAVDHGGAEWEAINLFEILTASKKPGIEVKLWTPKRHQHLSKLFSSRYPIQCISRLGFNWPRKGTFIFVGSYFRVRQWYRFAKPSRVIIVYNVLNQEALDRLYARSKKVCERVDVVHISEWMKEASSYEGVIHPSPINLDKFRPAEGKRNAQFTIGRLSRDAKYKFSKDDPSLFKMIVGMGCQVRLMGATTLRPALDDYKGIEILPVSSESSDFFLKKLDCFIYRTNESWVEPFGRVVMEAMACGLPVVCEGKGGYANLIKHGENGFLFTSTEEAVEIVRLLKSDSALCSRIGGQARLTMELIYSGEQLENRKNYYLGPEYS